MGAVIIRLLHMRKLRLKVKKFAQGHIAGKWQSGIPSQAVWLQSLLLTTLLSCLSDMFPPQATPCSVGGRGGVGELERDRHVKTVIRGITEVCVKCF